MPSFEISIEDRSLGEVDSHEQEADDMLTALQLLIDNDKLDPHLAQRDEGDVIIRIGAV